MSPNSPSRFASPPTLVTGSAPPGAATVVTGVHPVEPSTFNSELPTRAETRVDDLPELRPPLVVGDLGSCGGLRVVRVLGRGGMGAVYEAIDPVLGRRVALKLMLPELAESESGRERFLREARTAAAVRHENVVSVYAVGEDAGVPYLTMELLRGDHLGNVIGRGPALADVVRIGREVACGLAAAHALGVIHRDVKPANIWIEEPSGRVRLLDFGLARFGGELSAVERSARPGAAHLTAVGGVVGTPIYMAPEQVRGENVDARTDLFGLGVVLYQMVTGRLPFRRNRLLSVAAAIRAGTYVPVPELAPETPPRLVELIHRLLAPDPDARPPSADAVADELLAIGTHLLVSSGSANVAIPVRVPAAPPFNLDSDFDFDSDSAPSAPRRVETPSKLLLGSAALLLLVVGAAFGFAKRPAPLTAAPVPQVAAPQPPAPRSGPLPFTSLFNGRDLSGWHVSRGGLADTWTVRDGAIGGRPKDTDQVLLSDKEFANFELRMEYRWPKAGGHTVILLRAADTPDLVNDGISLNIGDDEGFPAVHGRTIGGLYRTGLIQGVTFEPTAVNRAIGSWNEIQVVARRQTIEVKLNGVRMPTADLTGKDAADAQRPGLNRPAGMIGLVCHWGPIEFRNITVRPITE